MDKPITILDVIRLKSQYTEQYHYYLVLDRMPKRIYERKADKLTAVDDGFYDFLTISPGTKGAFGDRKFEVTLTDGTPFECHGQVWATSKTGTDVTEDLVSVGVGTVDTLRECYVFSGASISAAKLNEWLSSNTAAENYDKYSPTQSFEWIHEHCRYRPRLVCSKRARKLRRRGAATWLDKESGRLAWSPRYDRAIAELIDARSRNGSVDIQSVLDVTGAE